MQTCPHGFPIVHVKHCPECEHQRELDEVRAERDAALARAVAAEALVEDAFVEAWNEAHGEYCDRMGSGECHESDAEAHWPGSYTAAALARLKGE